MKRYIKSQYIPDMTERYPEGRAARPYDASLDDADYIPRTLSYVLEELMDKHYSGCDKVVIQKSGSGRVLYEATSLEDAVTKVHDLGYGDASVSQSIQTGNVLVIYINPKIIDKSLGGNYKR